MESSTSSAPPPMGPPLNLELTQKGLGPFVLGEWSFLGGSVGLRIYIESERRGVRIV